MKLRWLSILCVLCASCGPMQPLDIKNYTIDAGAFTAAQSAPKGSVILVSALPAASGYNTANMLYTKTPYDVQAYALHAWVAPPGDLLLPVIVKALTATGHFKAVVMAPFTGATTLQLQMTLLMLQQEFTQDNQSRVHLSIQANLLNTTTGRVLANRIFTAVVPAGADAYSGVLATNQAARQIAVQVQQMVVEKD